MLGVTIKNTHTNRNILLEMDIMFMSSNISIQNCKYIEISLVYNSAYFRTHRPHTHVVAYPFIGVKHLPVVMLLPTDEARIEYIKNIRSRGIK